MSRLVIIVANHRTGSGCLASIIHTLGIPMIPTATPNMTGDDAWEDQDLVELHRAILGEVVGRRYDPSTWRYPKPKFDERIITHYRETLIEKCQQPVWGFKDPRTVWVLDFVIGLARGLEIDVNCVWLSRSVPAVADSLRRRDQKIYPGDHLDIATHQRKEWDRMFERFASGNAGVALTYEELIMNPAKTIQRVSDSLFPEPPSAERMQAAVNIVRR